MERTLVLQVPDDLYEPLAKTAQHMGQTPEELAVEWLAAGMHTVQDDPVERFIGAFSSTIPDWADHHDQYLGQTLMDQIRNPEGEDGGQS